MATLISQVDTAAPADASAANTLASQVRAFKAQVKDLLLVIMNDNGTLKDGVLGSAAQLGTGVVGSQQLGTGVVDSQHIAADAIEPVHMSDLSVLTSTLGDLAVTTSKLADAAVTAAKLATDAVETAKIKDAAVTGIKIANGTIADAKIADMSAMKLTDGTLGVAKFTVSSSDIRLPVVNTTTAGSKLATIGGALSATLVGDVLTFAIGSSGGAAEETTGFAAVAQNATGATAAGAYTDRVDYTRIRGESVLEIDGNYIKINDPGTYIVLYAAMGYSCGLSKVNLTTFDNDNRITGTASYAGPGQQTTSFGFDTLTVSNAGAKYKLRHYAELTQATNGQGLLVGGGGSDYTMRMVVISLN